jgi:nucleoside 2-deoxyribosyltransferase
VDIKRVYLAGPWVDRIIAKSIAGTLEKAGYTITHPWWNYEGEDQDKETPESLAKFAQMDVDAVRTADAVVVYNSAKSEGKAVEQGLAIAWNKPIIVITPWDRPSSNIFHNLSNYTHVTNLHAALEKLSGL